MSEDNEEKTTALERRAAYAAGIKGLSSTALMRFEPQSFSDAMAVAEIVAQAELCPVALKGRPGDILLVMMYGAEHGMTTMSALQNCHVIYGRVAPSTDWLVSRILESGKAVFFRPIEQTEKQATWETQRVGEDKVHKLTYTFAQAQKAGYVSREKSRWPKEPDVMCSKRAASRLGRAVYPDVLHGTILTSEEARDLDQEEREKDVTPKATRIAEAVAAARSARKEKGGPAAEEVKQAPEPEVINLGGGTTTEEPAETLPDPAPAPEETQVKLFRGQDFIAGLMAAAKKSGAPWEYVEEKARELAGDRFPGLSGATLMRALPDEEWKKLSAYVVGGVGTPANTADEGDENLGTATISTAALKKLIALAKKYKIKWQKESDPEQALRLYCDGELGVELEKLTHDQALKVRDWMVGE